MSALTAMAWAGCGGSPGTGTDTAPPEVTLSTPANGAVEVAPNGALLVAFSEAIDPATVSDSSFTLVDASGATVPGTVSVHALTATFTPATTLTHQSGYTATVSTAVRDLAGNPLAAEYVFTFTTASASDTTGPDVILSAPVDGATGAAPNGALLVAFSEAVDPGTVTTDSFILADGSGAAVPGTVSLSGLTATFTPTASLAYESNYTATVSTTVKDLAGNPLATSYVFSFTTAGAPDTTGPEVTLVTPADGDTHMTPTQDVAVVFSEAIDPASVTVASFTLTDGLGLAVPGTLSANDSAARFTPSGPLVLAGRYTATVTTGITDLAGNALVAEMSWSFTVRDGRWGAATLIETDDAGDGGDPRVAVDGSGNSVTVWQQSDGTRTNIWSNRYQVGVGWGSPVLIRTGAGDAEIPQVAMDGAGNAIAVWQQSDGARFNTWSNRYQAGVGWGIPELIETDDIGSAINPQVAVDPMGNAVAVWQQSDGAQFNIWSNHYEAGVGWGVAELIETDDAWPATDPQVAVDPMGNAMAVWLQADGIRINVMSNRFEPGVGWGLAEFVETEANSSRKPQVTMDPLGNAIVVWQQPHWTSTDFNVWSNRYELGAGWGVATLIELDDAGSATDPQVAVDEAGNAVAVWSQWVDGNRAIWSNRYELGAGWGVATRVGSILLAPGVYAQVAVDAVGNAIAVWIIYNGGRYEVWGSRYVAGVGWSASEMVELVGGDSAWNPQLAVTPAGHVIAVWAQSDGTNTNIWSNRFE